MLLSAQEIVTFRDADPPPGASPWVPGRTPMTDVRLVASDPRWPERYATMAAVIAEALGGVALSVEHVGSTAVPGLPAKPVIDIDLTVADSGEEAAYIPALERCGFTLVVREPWWYAAAKLAAAEETVASGGHAMDYDARKESVVREIYGRAFRGLGLLA